MSNYSFVTARSEGDKPVSILEKAYPGVRIDDSVLVDSKKGIYLGMTGFDKHVPLLRKALENDGLQSFLSDLPGNSVCLINMRSGVLLVNDKPVELSLGLVKAFKEAKQYFSDYGGFLNANGEHVINLKGAAIGPHFGVNLLLGDRSGFEEPLLTTPKSVVDQFGGGSFRGPSANQVLATSWGMLPEENGSPFNRQFYLLENGKQVFYSHDVHANVQNAECIHKVNHTEIAYWTTDALSIKRTIYLKPQRNAREAIALERQRVQITNTGSKTRNLSIVFTGMFGSPNPGCQMVDVIYQSVINQTGLIKDDNGNSLAIVPDYYPEYAREYTRFFSLGRSGFDSFSYDASYFIGNGSIEHPENLAFLDNGMKMKGPSFFAVSKHIHLLPGAKVELVTSTGLVDNHGDGKKLMEALEASLDANPDNELADIESSFVKYSSFLQVHTKDGMFDSYVNRNLPFQVLYQTFVSRAFAQTQKGYREIGFREIQDLYASLYYFVSSGKKDLAKELLAKWIANVYLMGYANHNFFFEGKEPGMCSDDQLWLVEAVYRYLDLTDDYGFLKEKFPIAGTTEERTLLETLKAIITYSSKISIGKHGIPLLDKADWNDCLKIDDDFLDGPTKEALYRKQLKDNKQEYGVPLKNDLSESVMNGFLLVIALKDMEAISLHLGDKKYQDELVNTRNKLEHSLRKHAYVNGYYARVLINRQSQYKYVGAPGDKLSLLDGFDGSLYLNSLSWSMLSGVASEEEVASMILLADKYLKTKSGYVLCTPHDLKRCGSKEASTEQYFLGDRENGGVFKHATMMFAVAALKESKKIKDKGLRDTLVKDADFMIDIVLPYNVLKDPYLYKGNPRYCTQYVNSITEEHIGPILSGTATWLLLALLERGTIK